MASSRSPSRRRGRRARRDLAWPRTARGSSAQHADSSNCSSLLARASCRRAHWHSISPAPPASPSRPRSLGIRARRTGRSPSPWHCSARSLIDTALNAKRGRSTRMLTCAPYALLGLTIPARRRRSSTRFACDLACALTVGYVFAATAAARPTAPRTRACKTPNGCANSI